MMTPEQLNLIVDSINNLSTHLDNITTALIWSMVALWTIAIIKIIHNK